VPGPGPEVFPPALAGLEPPAPAPIVRPNANEPLRVMSNLGAAVSRMLIENPDIVRQANAMQAGPSSHKRA
jgi:hypothetical protein